MDAYYVVERSGQVEVLVAGEDVRLHDPQDSCLLDAPEEEGVTDPHALSCTCW